MNKGNISIEGYKNYYGSIEFQKDLLGYFTVTDSYTNPKFPWIGFATRRLNPPRREGCPSRTRENNFYFSFCLFFHLLQEQAIYKLSGEKMMYKFHAETGVPMISCGLGGIMHPSHTLLEAGLLPQGEEVPIYVEMIDEIMPAIYNQVKELEAYAEVEPFYSFVKDEIIKFRDRLNNHERHPDYLIERI